MIPNIQLPGNPATDVARYYEGLTGKRLILDSALNGPNLTVMVPNPISKKDAIAYIESILVLNGYSIVNVDDKTAKLLGPSKPPRMEAVPLFSDPSQLPPGDEIVSYFMPFRYLKAEEAQQIFAQFAPFHPNLGIYTPVPSVNAVLITESAPIIRRLIAIKDMIDVEGAKTVTEFFVLQRADAEKVVEILSKIFEKDDAAANRSVAVNTPPNPGMPQGSVPPGAVGGGISAITGKIQVFADKRTNRVMVVAPEGRIPYIKTIVDNLDSAVNFEEPLERPLRFVKAGDVLPVLASLLADKDDKNGASNIVGGQNGQNGQNGSSDNSNSNGYNNNSNGLSGSSSSSGGPNVNTNTTYTAESTAPQSVIVGNARIIADRSVNKIIVIGPPESRQKAGQVLDMLDQRPKQVYLAVVIGQLTLGKNLEVGVNYLYKGTNATAGSIRALGTGATTDITNLLANRSGSLDLAPDTSTVTNTAVNAAAAAASTAIPALSGLTVYGSIANSVDILARAMAATSKFQIISRPVVYTSNGQPAVISSGQSVPVASGTLTSAVDTTANNNLGSSIASNVEYKDIVLELEVQPLINSDHEVTLRIKQKNDTIQGQTTVSGNSYPTLGVQALNTTITVPNRNTVVLGGLISEQEDRTETGIPLLKDIPGLGYLFSNTVKNKTRRELIIMIQPFIVDTDDKLKEVNYIERANTGFKEHLFDEPIPVKAATLPAPEELTDPRAH